MSQSEDEYPQAKQNKKPQLNKGQISTPRTDLQNEAQPLAL